jgi:fused signal recognition particle receptor
MTETEINAAIAEKVAAGLSKEMARQVVEAQIAEDAARNPEAEAKRRLDRLQRRMDRLGRQAKRIEFARREADRVLDQAEAARVFGERAEREQAEREARERAEREQAEREAREKAEAEAKAAAEAAEKAAAETEAKEPNKKEKPKGK